MPQTVHKLPFRLDEIPFFDSTMLCDPVMDRYYTPGTGNDSDDDSWDAPLKRAPTVAAKITVATRLPDSPLLSLSTAFADEFDNINEPFSRDPNATINPLANRRGSHVLTAPPAVRRHGGAGGQRAQRSHQTNEGAPMPSSHELRDRFEERSSGSYANAQQQRPASLKKRAAPRAPCASSPYAYAGIPAASSQRRNSFGKKMRAPMPATATMHNGNTSNGNNVAKMNPVREMELRGIRQQRSANEVRRVDAVHNFRYEQLWYANCNGKFLVAFRTKSHRSTFKRCSAKPHTIAPR